MKRKHEAHENHERWVISYADMITLLFALFVVLYTTNMAKIKNEVAHSIAFALHIAGEGRTQDEGIFDRGKGDGDMLDAFPLINAQDKGMREFLSETLPQEFKDVAGKSIEVLPGEDTVTFRTQLSAFFERDKIYLRKGISDWLKTLVENAHTFTSIVRVRIEAPMANIGVNEDNTARKSGEFCAARLLYLQRMLGLTNVAPEQIITEFRYLPANAPAPPGATTWEDKAVISFGFSNKDKTAPSR